MKILLVSQEYPPETAHGGIATQTHLKAHGLAELGHEVIVVSHSVDGSRGETIDGTVTVIRIPGPHSSTEAARWIRYSAAVAAELERQVVERSPDLIDFPEYGAEPYVYLLNRGSEAVPVVMQVQGPLVMLANTIGWPSRDSDLFEVGTHMESVCLRKADAVYTSSRYSLDWCRRAYDLPLDAAPTIHMGVDTTTFQPDLAEARSDPTIVSVGRVASSKGSAVLVEAVCRVARSVPHVRLVLCGRHEKAFRDYLDGLVRSEGLPDLLEWRGEMGRADLPQLLSGCHVFAAPSLIEGGPGFVFLEAMACGLPVVGCSGSGIEETVSSGTGILVPPNSVDALADALERLLLDPQERAVLGGRARAAVVDLWETRACAARLEGFYRSVLDSSDRPTPALARDES